jgi:hypothetical protein
MFLVEKTRSKFTDYDRRTADNKSVIGRENDKVKEDALAHLSDQLLFISERIYNSWKENK